MGTVKAAILRPSLDNWPQRPFKQASDIITEFVDQARRMNKGFIGVEYRYLPLVPRRKIYGR